MLSAIFCARLSTYTKSLCRHSCAARCLVMFPCSRAPSSGVEKMNFFYWQHLGRGSWSRSWSSDFWGLILFGWTLFLIFLHQGVSNYTSVIQPLLTQCLSHLKACAFLTDPHTHPITHTAEPSYDQVSTCYFSFRCETWFSKSQLIWGFATVMPPYPSLVFHTALYLTLPSEEEGPRVYAPICM